jgi:hypothetical protein
VPVRDSLAATLAAIGTNDVGMSSPAETGDETQMTTTTEAEPIQGELVDDDAELRHVLDEVDDTSRALEESPAADQLPALLSRGTDVVADLDQRMRIAEHLANASMLPSQYRRQPGNVLAAQFAADALGIPLFTAIQKLHFLDGKVGMAAELMRALARREGHRYEMWLEDNDTKAVMVIHLFGDAEPKAPVEYTLDEAIKAQLCRRDRTSGEIIARSERGKVLPWEAHTTDMLVARVTSRTIRRHCPEVLQGMSYTEDELQEAARTTPQVVQVQVPADASARAEQQTEARASVDQLRAGTRAPVDTSRAQQSVSRAPGAPKPEVDEQDRLGWLRAEAAHQARVFEVTRQELFARQIDVLEKPLDEFSADELQRAVVPLRAHAIAKMREQGMGAQAAAYETVPSGAVMPLERLLGTAAPAEDARAEESIHQEA